MVKTRLSSPISSLESCRNRLACHRRRLFKRRQLLLQHFFGEILNLQDTTAEDASEDLYLQAYLLKKISEALGRRSNMSSHFNEDVKKKSIIMPVVRRLKPPWLSSSATYLLVSTSLDSQRYLLPEDKTNGTSEANKALTRSPSELQTSKRDADDFICIKSYSGSSTFLKGTQSANPHNDYSQHFVDTGERPQNFIRDTGLQNRFEEYPKLRELIRLKDQLIRARATPPMYLRTDLLTFDLAELDTVFDVILVEPPLKEYKRTLDAVHERYWTWQEIERLEIEKITSNRSFIWVWCGSGEGLEDARRCLRKWGFRRCEDICWIKPNKSSPGHEQLEPGAVFQRTKEHCLMGIHGTVRRSTDGDFIHANLDIDLIINEAKAASRYSGNDRPTEIFHIIEHFCQGRRRLHLFGKDSTLRAGWLTVGSGLSASNFDAQVYKSCFSRDPNAHLLGTTEEIERLRPKSPPPRFSSSAVGGNGSPTPLNGLPILTAGVLSSHSSINTLKPADSLPSLSTTTGSSLLGLPSLPPMQSCGQGFVRRSGARNVASPGLLPRVPNAAAALAVWRFATQHTSTNTLLNNVLNTPHRPFLNYLLSSRRIRPQADINALSWTQRADCLDANSSDVGTNNAYLLNATAMQAVAALSDLETSRLASFGHEMVPSTVGQLSAMKTDLALRMFAAVTFRSALSRDSEGFRRDNR